MNPLPRVGGQEIARERWKTWRLVLIVFVLALVVRVGFVLTLDSQKLYWWDEGEFDQIAWDLAQGKGYVAEPHRANPVLPVTMAAAYAVFGHHFVAARIAQAAFGAGVCALVLLIAEMVGGRRAGLTAGVIASFYPHLIYVTGVFYAANLLAFWLASSVALLYVAMRRGTWPWAAACGVACGLAVLTRPACMAFVLVATLLILFARTSAPDAEPSQKPAKKLRWKAASACVLAAAALVAPWSIRNMVAYDRFLLVAAGGGKALWMGNNELSRGDSDDRYLDIGSGIWRQRLDELPAEERERIRSKHEQFAADSKRRGRIGQDGVYAREALQNMVFHPLRTAARALRRIGTLYSAATPTRTRTTHSSIAKRITAGVAFYPVLALGLLGVVLSRRDRWRLLPLYGLIVTYTFSYAMLTASTRFRIPIDFCWIVLAGLCLSRVPLGRQKPRRHAYPP